MCVSPFEVKVVAGGLPSIYVHIVPTRIYGFNLSFPSLHLRGGVAD